MFGDRVKKRLATPETGTGGKPQHQLKKSPFPRRHTTPNIQIADEITATIQDRGIIIDTDNSRRRTIVVKPRRDAYGFDLESYRIYHKETAQTEIISFVSKVEDDGPAYIAGMRPGDVIASVNGTSVINLEHEYIVRELRASVGCDLRLVVVFEDYMRKIELHKKLNTLKRTLRVKEKELRNLEIEEGNLLRKGSRPVSLESAESYSDMSGIVDLGSLSLSTGWNLREPITARASPRASRHTTVSSSSLPLPSPTKEFGVETFKLDRRTFAGNSLDTEAADEEDNDIGIQFKVHVVGENDSENYTRELKSPDSGYDEQRNSKAISEESEDSVFRFPKVQEDNQNEDFAFQQSYEFKPAPNDQFTSPLINDPTNNEDLTPENVDKPAPNEEIIFPINEFAQPENYVFQQPDEPAPNDEIIFPINEDDEETSFCFNDDTEFLLDVVNDDDEDTAL